MIVEWEMLTKFRLCATKQAIYTLVFDRTRCDRSREGTADPNSSNIRSDYRKDRSQMIILLHISTTRPTLIGASFEKAVLLE